MGESLNMDQYPALPPQFLKAIVVAQLLGEYVQYDIPVIKQDPPALCIPFDLHRLKLTTSLDLRFHRLSQSIQSSLACPCADDKVISKRANIPQIKDDDILPLGFIQDV